jgi:hypothetical protein
MSGQRESRTTDVAFMILGLMIPAVGYAVTKNAIVYLPDDPRAQPWYPMAVLAVSFGMGSLLFVVGVLRLWQSRTGGRK